MQRKWIKNSRNQLKPHATVAGFLMQWQEDQTEGVGAGISEYTCGFSLLWCFTGTPLLVDSLIPSTNQCLTEGRGVGTT